MNTTKSSQWARLVVFLAIWSAVLAVSAAWCSWDSNVDKLVVAYRRSFGFLFLAICFVSILSLMIAYIVVGALARSFGKAGRSHADASGESGKPGGTILCSKSVVLGLLAVCSMVVPLLGIIIALPAGIASITLGIVALVRTKRARATLPDWWKGVAGIGLGVIALSLVVMFFAAVKAGLINIMPAPT